MTLAIDFGTSNTVVARWNAALSQPETLSLQGLSKIQVQTPPLVPSLVYVKDAQTPDILVGQQVSDRGLDIANDVRFFANFKRGIGQELQGFLPSLDGQMVSFEQVGTWFLQTALKTLAAQTELGGSLILTVPVDSFEAYRNWLSSVVEQLPLEQVRLIDEPTAAALGYQVADRNVLLVVDFGGGTLDLSLVKLQASASGNTNPLGFILKWGQKSFANQSGQRLQLAKVLAKAGCNLGGADLDQWIAAALARDFNLEATPLLTRVAERLKVELSTQAKAQEAYFNEDTFESTELSLDRAQLDAILTQHDFFTQLDTLMRQVLQQGRRQGIEVADIDAVLLVGGTTQIPAVQTWVAQYFDTAKIRSERPFEAIAQGALQVAQGVDIKDFLYHSYGIRYWNHRNKQHDWHAIIPAGQAYPMASPFELVLGASVENQPYIELVLGELADHEGGIEVYFDGDRLVTRQLESRQTLVKPLNDTDQGRSLASLTPPGSPGVDRIKLLFWVDDSRFLRVTVKDLLTLETLVENQPVVQLN
ncbi:MAG: Hsp70 family protein [Cyanobacteria bacterium P01_H01_bin.121]